MSDKTLTKDKTEAAETVVTATGKVSMDKAFAKNHGLDPSVYGDAKPKK